jgi:hypothetical protein
MSACESRAPAAARLVTHCRLFQQHRSTNRFLSSSVCGIYGFMDVELKTVFGLKTEIGLAYRYSRSDLITIEIDYACHIFGILFRLYPYLKNTFPLKYINKYSCTACYLSYSRTRCRFDQLQRSSDFAYI